MGELSPELYMVFLAPICALLFALGGTQISTTIKGQKWLRRFVLPAILGLAVGFAITWWQGLLVGCLACASLHQGYGDRASWLKRTLIFLSYGLISLPIGWSLWNIFTPIIAMSLFVLCNLKVDIRDYDPSHIHLKFGDVFVWKFFELSMGFLIGFQVAYILAGHGHIW
jgi:hypothetical protein